MSRAACSGRMVHGPRRTGQGTRVTETDDGFGFGHGFGLVHAFTVSTSLSTICAELTPSDSARKFVMTR